MDPLILICIVLAVAILWLVIVWGMLTLLGRAERRSGVRAPRQSAVDLRRKHGTPRRFRVRRGRTSHRVALHR